MRPLAESLFCNPFQSERLTDPFCIDHGATTVLAHRYLNAPRPAPESASVLPALAPASPWWLTLSLLISVLISVLDSSWPAGHQLLTVSLSLSQPEASHNRRTSIAPLPLKAIMACVCSCGQHCEVRALPCSVTDAPSARKNRVTCSRSLSHA